MWRSETAGFQLSKSIETIIRVNAVWALKNLIFLVNNRCKEEIFTELTTSTLMRLITDPEASVQEQALAFIRNLVDGNVNSIDLVFDENRLLLHAIGKQLRSTSLVEVMVQVRKFSICRCVMDHLYIDRWFTVMTRASDLQQLII